MSEENITVAQDVPTEFAGSETRLSLSAHDVTKPALFDVNGVPVLALPPQYSQHKLAELTPVRHAQREPYITASVAVSDTKSFLSYLGRFRIGPAAQDEIEQTYFESSANEYAVRAHFDYHKIGAPGYNRHCLTRKFETDDNFDAWRQFASGAFHSQEAFVEFLEDRTGDLADVTEAPVSQAQLLSIIANFKATQTMVCNSAINRTSGDVRLEFVKDTVQKHEVVLPEKILLALPVFKNGGKYGIWARLAFRLKESKVSFSVKLIRIDDLVETAFNEEVDALEVAIKADIVRLA